MDASGRRPTPEMTRRNKQDRGGLFSNLENTAAPAHWFDTETSFVDSPLVPRVPLSRAGVENLIYRQAEWPELREKPGTAYCIQYL